MKILFKIMMTKNSGRIKKALNTRLAVGKRRLPFLSEKVCVMSFMAR